MKLNRRVPMVLTVLLLTAVMFSGGCGGGSDPLPSSPDEIQVGSKYEGTLSIEDNGQEKTIGRMEYEAHNIETDKSLPPVVALFVNQEERFDETTGTLKIFEPEENSRPTPESVRKYLVNEWDEAHGGVQDKGVNAREFLQFLAKYNMSMDQFFRFAEASGGLTVDQFIFLIDLYSTKLFPLYGTEVFGEIESFCDFVGIELQIYFTNIRSVFETHVAYCEKLLELHNRDESHLCDSYKDWLDKQSPVPVDPFVGFLKYLKNLPAKAQDVDAAGTAEVVLDVLKFAWDVIKDGKPQVSTSGAFTSVLKQGTTALDYGYAKRNETSIMHFKVTDAWIKSWVLIETKFCGTSSYAAVSPNFGGRYLQNVQFDVESAYAQWGMNLNVSAQVSNVTNSASVENPDPEIDIVARINSGWLFQSFGRSAYFRAKGSEGIRFQRWGEN